MGGTCDDRSSDRSYPEQPQLLQRPTADKQSGTSASRRIYRGVCHGNAYEVNQRQRETNCNRRQTFRSARVRSSEDHDQEEERHHNFRYQGGYQRVSARRMIGITVRGESGADIESGLTRRDEIKNSGAGNRANQLCSDVRNYVLRRNSTRGKTSQRHSWIEVPARNMANSISHGKNRQTERERHAEQSNAYLRESRRQHRAAATPKNEPHGSQKLCR